MSLNMVKPSGSDLITTVFRSLIEIVHLKSTILSLFTHRRFIPNLYDFLSSVEHTYFLHYIFQKLS